MRCSMSEGSMSDFEWWWWFDESDIRWRACVVTTRSLKRYEVIEIRWLSGIENFVSQRDDLIFDSFRNFKPVKSFQNRSDMLEFWSLDNSSSSSLDVLETIYLIFWKTIVTESCSSQARSIRWKWQYCFGAVKVKVWTDTADSTNVIIAGFRQCRDLIGKGKMFFKYKAKGAGRLSVIYTVQRRGVEHSSPIISGARTSTIEN